MNMKIKTYIIYFSVTYVEGKPQLFVLTDASKSVTSKFLIVLVHC